MPARIKKRLGRRASRRRPSARKMKVHEEIRSQVAVDIYKVPGTMEFIPRSRKEEDIVFAKPIHEDRECVICGASDSTKECKYCGLRFCKGHLSPEKHKCIALPPGKAAKPEEHEALKASVMNKLEWVDKSYLEIFELLNRATDKELAELAKSFSDIEDVLASIDKRGP